MSNSLTLADLGKLIESQDIEDTYALLGYDYEQVLKNCKAAESSRAKKRFLKIFDWKKPPSDEIIRRLFNQINTYYAESWAIAHPSVSPSELLSACGRLILFRQGKQYGLRHNDIGFGERKMLDVLDPIRSLKWVQGIAPRFLRRSIDKWSDCIDQCKRTDEAPVFLMVAMLAIHPFVDGNGRLARITYTWLKERWGWEKQWIAEGTDGEFFRTGQFQDSTEYLTGRFVIDLCGGYNEIPYLYGKRLTQEKQGHAFDCFDQNMECFTESPAQVLGLDSFNALREHLHTDGHFMSISPRFECLRDCMA